MAEREVPLRQAEQLAKSEVPLLQVEQLAKSYGPVEALRSADLTIAPGEIHALVGANGAGKSTLVKILAGVVAPDGGRVLARGRPLSLSRPTDALAAGIGTVFQDPALIPDLTVAQNLKLTHVERDRIDVWLRALDLADLDGDQRISDLPLETLRLLDLARTLSREPDLLVLDEMTAALPADRAGHVFDVMNTQRASGRSVLFITHRLSEVRQTCDRATVLRDGRDVATLDPRAGDEAALVEAMLGEAATAVDEGDDRGAARTPGAVALGATDVQLGRGLRGVSFELREGEILGIAALEGQGQDRLFSVLSGDRRPSAGTITVGGEELRARSPYDAVRRGVVLIPADRLLALLPNRSVTENLAVPFYSRVAGWFRLAADEPAKVAGAVERLSIDTRAQSQVRRLSGGNQQKVAIGRWLAAGFRTLLCFDPTRGIDIGTKNQIYGLLRELAAGGAAVLLYTSELAEIPLVCDRVLVMYDGSIVDQLDGPSATEEELLAAAHGLEPAT